jgi:tRNA U34 2-thiouridine synthase MnmA/TrmU
MKKIKALVLFSGGLDSIIAAELLKRQNIEILALSFKSYFFDGKEAKKAAESIKIPLRIVDFSEEHLRLVINPRHGYGKSVNPCIDCHALMLKKAKEIMEKEKFAFVATGEVLGQRPMSQNKQSLRTVLRESSLEGYLLRPLSAKLLDETILEKKGLIDRQKLLDISGRSRKKQIELAKKWGIKEYSTPAGGCLLTDLEFGRKLKELINNYPKFSGNDVQLLKIGRHFWQEKTKIIIGRNEKENKQIKKLSRPKDILIEMNDFPGPLALIRNYESKNINKSLKEAKSLILKYSNKVKNKTNIVFNIKKDSQDLFN